MTEHRATLADYDKVRHLADKDGIAATAYEIGYREGCRATVERIRAAVLADVKISSKQSERRMLAILDEEAAR